jgi:hypothetical protein
MRGELAGELRQPHLAHPHASSRLMREVWVAIAAAKAVESMPSV